MCQGFCWQGESRSTSVWQRTTHPSSGYDCTAESFHETLREPLGPKSPPRYLITNDLNQRLADYEQASASPEIRDTTYSTLSVNSGASVFQPYGSNHNTSISDSARQRWKEPDDSIENYHPVFGDNSVGVVFVEVGHKRNPVVRLCFENPKRPSKLSIFEAELNIALKISYVHKGFADMLDCDLIVFPPKKPRWLKTEIGIQQVVRYLTVRSRPYNGTARLPQNRQRRVLLNLAVVEDMMDAKLVLGRPAIEKLGLQDLKNPPQSVAYPNPESPKGSHNSLDTQPSGNWLPDPAMNTNANLDTAASLYIDPTELHTYGAMRPVSKGTTKLTSQASVLSLVTPSSVETSAPPSTAGIPTGYQVGCGYTEDPFWGCEGFEDADDSNI